MSLYSKSHDSPVKKLNLLTLSGKNYLNSVCDDAEVEQLSMSRTGNENGEIIGTVSVKSPSVVSGNISVIDQLDWLKDNLSNEFELLNYGSIKDDLFSVPSCSKSSCADPEIEHSSNQNGEIFAKVSVQGPLVVPETIPAREISSSLDKSEDQLNWLKDNQSNEFDLQNHGIIKEDVFSVAECSSSSCDGTEVEQLSPSKTGNGNGELFSTMLVEPSLVSETISAAKISDSLNKSEDQRNWLRDNLSNEFELQNHGIIKDLFSVQSCLNSSCDDTEVEHSSPWYTVSEIADSLNNSKHEMNWLRDSLSNEFEPNNRWTIKEDPFSGPNCANSFCDVTELEPSSPWETCNENGNVFTAVAIQAPLLVSETLSVTEISDSLNKSEDQLNWFLQKSQDNFLKRSTQKVSSALKWIEECMVNTRWWIHMDDEILLASEAESHVLETALLLRKEITDQKIIILSNDLTVKIKAMAEGVMCETAEEFHRSLVNPFSERFMWAGSLARGLTWSCVDDDIVRQKYYGCSLNGPHMLKGLKLLARVTTFQ